MPSAGRASAQRRALCDAGQECRASAQRAPSAAPCGIEPASGRGPGARSAPRGIRARPARHKRPALAPGIRRGPEISAQRRQAGRRELAQRRARDQRPASGRRAQRPATAGIARHPAGRRARSAPAAILPSAGRARWRAPGIAQQPAGMPGENQERIFQNARYRGIRIDGACGRMARPAWRMDFRAGCRPDQIMTAEQLPDED